MALHGISFRSCKSSIIAIVIVLLGTLAPTDSRGDSGSAKSSVPEAAAQAKARTIAREVYKGELDKAKRPAEKIELSTKVLRAAEAEGKDLAARYVLLSIALDVAVEAGDVDGAIRAVDAMDASFVIDAARLRATSALAAVVAKVPRTPAMQKEIVAAVDPLISQQMLLDHHEVSRQLAEIALGAARASGDAALARTAAARLQQVRDVSMAFDGVQPALAMLKRAPDDAEANLKVGSFYCFAKNDWTAGLPHLSKGSDPKLKAMAERERAEVMTAEEQVSLGDGWWEIAEKLPAPAKVAVQQRAATWYRAALAKLDTGLVRSKVEGRIRTFTGATAPGAAAAQSVNAIKPQTSKGYVDLTLNDLPKFASKRLVPSWEHMRIGKTLASQTVTDTLVLRKADSPYLITGFLLVETGATLKVEPGVIVLFAPEVKLTSKGRIELTSDDQWIALVSADRNQKWKGILSSGGKVTARRCLLVGAELGIVTERAEDGLVAMECIFAGNGKAVVSGEHGWLKVEDCLFLRNEVGIGSTSDGFVSFSKCLCIGNAKGYESKYDGGCKGSSSTFYNNEIGLESGLYAGVHPIEIRDCNIVGSSKLQVKTDGQPVNARHNFWGRGLGHDVAAGQNTAVQGKVEAFEWSDEAFKEALPSLPLCPYLER